MNELEAQESLRLLKAFFKIKDPDVRKQIIEEVERRLRELTSAARK
jgi:hypothetical protein